MLDYSVPENETAADLYSKDDSLVDQLSSMQNVNMNLITAYNNAIQSSYSTNRNIKSAMQTSGSRLNQMDA